MIILGIDPGSRKIGYAFLEVLKTRGMRFRYLDSGVLRFDKIPIFMDRVRDIYTESEGLLQNIMPDEIAIESLIYVKSPTSLIKLSQARGAMLAAFLKTHKEKVFEYSPNLIKSTTTGHGHANKENIQKFLGTIFGNLQFETDDESDALAIAVCHAINRDIKQVEKKEITKKRKYYGLANSVKHRIKT